MPRDRGVAFPEFATIPLRRGNPFTVWRRHDA